MSESNAKPKRLGVYESIWKGIVRPPRFMYQLKDLGNEVWVLKNCVIRRYDFVVTNKRQLNVQCR